MGVCISRSPALCLAPSPGPQFVFTGPGPQFVFTSPVLQFVFTSTGFQFAFTNPGLQFHYQSGTWVCIYQPCLLNLYLYLRPWPTIFITDPRSEFPFTLLLLVGPWLPICIYWAWPPICIYSGLQHYYRSGAWICIYLIVSSSSSGSGNSSSSNFFGIDKTSICMPILVI